MTWSGKIHNFEVLFNSICRSAQIQMGKLCEMDSTEVYNLHTNRMNNLRDLGFELEERLPHSPDLAPTVMEAVESWFADKKRLFFKA